MTDQKDIRMVSFSFWDKNRETPGKRNISQQSVRGIQNRLVKALGAEGIYQFKSISDGDNNPNLFFNASKSECLKQITASSNNISDNTTLVFHYLGHATVVSGELALFFKSNNKIGHETYLFENIINVIEATGYKNCVIILDCCHSGNPSFAIDTKMNYFVMFATDSGYAFNNYFSDTLIDCLKAAIVKDDYRIDRKKKAITIEKIFQQTKVLFKRNYPNIDQDPQSLDGGLAGLSIAPAPVADGVSVNRFASARTIYGRLFVICETVASKSLSYDELLDEVRNSSNFRLRRGIGEDFHVGKDRVKEYINFLISARIIVSNAGFICLTDSGVTAYQENRFNQVLLVSLEEYILPDDVDFNSLDDVIDTLIGQMMSPTFAAIRREFEMRYFFSSLPRICD